MASSAAPGLCYDAGGKADALRRGLLRDGWTVLPRACENIAEFEALADEILDAPRPSRSRPSLHDQVSDGASSQITRVDRLLAHAEAFYNPLVRPPELGLLCCDKAPEADGGETFVVDGAEFYRALPPRLASRLRRAGVVYGSVWDRARWRKEFDLDDEAGLLELLERSDRARFQLSNGVLHLRCWSPAIIEDKEGTPRFINGLLGHLPFVDHPRYQQVQTFSKPTNYVLWGDDDVPLGNEEVNALIDTHDHCLVKHRWRHGDVLAIDNYLCLHGREALSGPGERRLYSRFGYRASS